MDTNTPTEAAATPRFKRGDVVRFNSGGPLMTVQEPAMYEDDTVECSWFTSDYSSLLTETFFEECLTPVTP